VPLLPATGGSPPTDVLACIKSGTTRPRAGAGSTGGQETPPPCPACSDRAGALARSKAARQGCTVLCKGGGGEGGVGPARAAAVGAAQEVVAAEVGAGTEMACARA
jgi:hypothetical protein